MGEIKREISAIILIKDNYVWKRYPGVTVFQEMSGNLLCG
jgi:hypothetical protein